MGRFGKRRHRDGFSGGLRFRKSSFLTGAFCWQQWAAPDWQLPAGCLAGNPTRWEDLGRGGRLEGVKPTSLLVQNSAGQPAV